MTESHDNTLFPFFLLAALATVSEIFTSLEVDVGEPS
jgi:hypothetical protein